MSDEINYKNNPLHGVGLKSLLTEMVDHYGFDILYAYLSINCFKTNPSIDSSVKFLKKTDWAREKVEGLYLYEYKNLPRASADQYALSPRDRIIPEGQEPGEPAVLSLEDAARLQEKREQKAAERREQRANAGKRFGGEARGGRSNSRDSGSRGSSSRESSHRESSKSDNVWKQSSDSTSSSDTPTTGGSDPWAKWK